MPSRTDSLRIATGLIALHVADDSFVQPESGTGPVDHLASGLIPLMLLVIALVRFPRMGAGRQAIAAFAIGLLGVVGATEGVYYAMQVGPSGDDFTGLVAGVAGIALLGLGAVTLWQSRRLDERRIRRYPRRAALAAAAVAVVAFVGFPLVLAYTMTHTARAIVPAAHLGAEHENVDLRTSDGLRLEGWYVPSRNGAAVIVFPGRKGPQRITRMLARHGYGVLLFDRRGEGASDGDPNAWGWGGDRDILAAAEFLEDRPDVDPGRIGGVGLSVGGELMLQVAAETEALKAVVSDGAGARAWSEDIREVTGAARLISAPTLAAKTVGTALFSNTKPPPSLFDLLPRIERPVFLIRSPTAVNERLGPEYEKLPRGPTRTWAVPGAGHTQGSKVRPAEYERRVVGFFDRRL
jgi:hypothetical protein